MNHEPLSIKTPFLRSTPLSAHLNKDVFLKFESSQPSGSFKSRGIGVLCQEYKIAGVKGLVASSGGNAGLAVACAGRVLGLPVTVFVPDTVSQHMVQKMKAEGAEVRVAGSVWDEAHEQAVKYSNEKKCGYVHPFDHPSIWCGHSQMIEEIAAESKKPGCVVLAVGGGGLLCGVVEGLHKVGWHDVPVFAVETEGAASCAAAFRAGRLVTLEKITSVAITLGAKTVCKQVLYWKERHNIQSAIVTDEAAIRACTRFVDDHRVLVEPACGAALSTVYDQFPGFSQASSVVVVVCGGSANSVEQLKLSKS